jgi:hypothetical protein
VADTAAGRGRSDREMHGAVWHARAD